MNSATALFTHSFLLFAFAFMYYIFIDFCNVQEGIVVKQSVTDYNGLFPMHTQDFLDVCLFSKKPTALMDHLGFGSSVIAYDNFAKASAEFVQASSYLTSGLQSVNPYPKTQASLNSYLNKPSTLTFDVQNLIQPEKQLSLINQMTDLDVSQDSANVCDNARD